MTDPISVEDWTARLDEAFAKGISPEPLALAQEALRAHPTDPGLVHLAALAALVAHKPALCLRYLKRLGKRYEPLPCDHLLRALVLVGQGQATQALQVLKRHGLDTRRNASWHFRGGPVLTQWMFGVWSEAFWQATPLRSTAKAKVRAARAEPRKRAPPPPPAPAAPPAAPELPQVAPRIDVEFAWESRALPLAEAPAGDSGRFRLRAELARLALLQGFDELLCLSQLQGVETYWYQVETVRKVLKQFRGRVLLADEVGLGKTVEAGMVLKEYVLRGMVDRFLILTPATPGGGRWPSATALWGAGARPPRCWSSWAATPTRRSWCSSTTATPWLT